jgi:hypothetical protein
MYLRAPLRHLSLTYLRFLSGLPRNSKELSAVYLVVEFTRARTSTKVLSMKTKYIRGWWRNL